MRHWPIKQKITAMASAVTLSFALFSVITALLWLQGAADGRTATAQARLEAAINGNLADLARQGNHMAQRASIARIPQKTDPTSRLAVASTFTGATGRAVDSATDLVMVTREDGSLALSLVRATIDTAALPQVQDALGGQPSRGLAWVANRPIAVAATPLYLDGTPKPVGALVVGRRLTDADFSAWSKTSGARVSLTATGTAPPPAPLLGPNWQRAWSPTPLGPVIQLTLASQTGALLANNAPLLGGAAVVALLLLWWALRLGRAVVTPIQRLEYFVAETCAGREPEFPSVDGDTEAGRMAANVNHLVGKLAHRDKEALESANRLATLMSQTVDAVFLFDRSGRIREANVKAQRLTGLSLDALHARDIIACVADDRDLQSDIYRRFMTCLSGQSEVFETRFNTAGGQSVAVEVSAGLISGLEAPMVQAVVRDISQRKQMEAQLAQAEKMEGIGTLAGGIAHDFNNILGGILGYAALVKGMVADGAEKADPRLFRYTDIIERSATRASELTQQLLGYARGGKYQVKRIRPNEVMDEVASLMRADMAQHGITIDTQLDTHLPAIEADSGQLHQVLTNLCVNARDAMPGGGRLRMLSEAVQLGPGEADSGPSNLPPGRYVRLTVADTGDGMSPEVQKRIFEPFFTTKPPGAGSGLGLAMVYGIMRNHSGQVTVASQPGKGSAMRLYLPALEGSMRVIEGRAKPVASGGAETIMVVDDETTLLELAKEILTGMGYDVVLARDGEEAMALFDKEQISLVILDIVMPRMGGKETYTRLKKLAPDLPVIVSSGFSRHGQAHDLMEMGANAFVQKPYRPDDLSRVVRETLDKAKNGDVADGTADGQQNRA